MGESAGPGVRVVSRSVPSVAGRPETRENPAAAAVGPDSSGAWAVGGDPVQGLSRVDLRTAWTYVTVSAEGRLPQHRPTARQDRRTDSRCLARHRQAVLGRIPAAPARRRGTRS